MTENIKAHNDNEEHDQAPNNTTLTNTLPDKINNVELGSEDQKGLLSPLLDPIGQGLQNVLSPLGNLIGGIGDGMAACTTRDQEGKENRGDGGYEKFGGKEQNGGNPLGL
ncbi:hypothetical protein D6C77_08920 [Aureobasidium pullulans]|nr:hypothetical protein D6C77_08920 [Aureobasidium pullulans]